MHMQGEIRQGDIIKVEGLEGYYKIISMQKLGTVNKVELFSLKNNNLLTILSPPYELRRVASPIQLAREGKFAKSLSNIYITLRMAADSFGCFPKKAPFTSSI